MQDKFNVQTWTSPTLNLPKDRIDLDIIYIDDEDDKIFEESIQIENLLFQELGEQLIKLW